MPAKKFGSLLSAPPKPLPDDDEMMTTPPPPPVENVPDPVVVLPPDNHSEPLAAPEPEADHHDVEPEPAPAAGEPPRSPATPSKESARVTEAPAPPKVPLTVRLHMPAARALREGWFEARRTEDPALSSPTFASEIVMLGLEAHRKKKRL